MACACHQCKFKIATISCLGRDSHSWDTSVEKAICRNPIWCENLIYLILCYSLWNYKVYTETNNFIFSFIARQKTFLPGGSEHSVHFMLRITIPGICASAWSNTTADVHPQGTEFCLEIQSPLGQNYRSSQDGDEETRKGTKFKIFLIYFFLFRSFISCR